MNKLEFLEVMLENELRPVGNAFIGVVEGWPVMTMLTGKNTMSVTFGLSGEEWKERKKDITAAFKGLGRAAWGNNRLVVSVVTKKLDNVYVQGVQASVRALKGCGVSCKNACAICGGANCDIAAFINGAARPAHSGCLDKLVGRAKESAEENERSGSYICGIVGALLGMLVGIIPSFLTIIFMERIFALLFALIPLCAYYGYKLFKGRMNKAVVTVSIVMSIVGIYVLQFAVVGYSLVADYYLTVGEMFSVMPVFLGDISVWAELTVDSIMDFVFVAIGVTMVWSQINTTSASVTAGAEAVKNSAVPFGEHIGVSDLYPNDYYGKNFSDESEKSE
ncbi:MAG: hypothetical protein ACI3VB_05370 [Oscillospiraceae bacterium]